MSIVDGLIVAVALVPIAAFRDLRTVRAAVFVSALAAALVLAGGLDQPLQGIAKGLVVWSYVGVFLWFQHLLAGRSASEARVDRAIRRIVTDADSLARARTVDAGIALSRWELIQHRIDALQAPNSDWAAVVALVDQYCRLLLEPTATEPVTSGPDARPELERVKSQLSIAWEVALRHKTNAAP